jgi:hypothetical protein
LLLQVLEQTKEIQGNTQAALYDQRQQMHRIESGLDKVWTHPSSLGLCGAARLVTVYVYMWAAVCVHVLLTADDCSLLSAADGSRPDLL